MNPLPKPILTAAGGSRSLTQARKRLRKIFNRASTCFSGQNRENLGVNSCELMQFLFVPKCGEGVTRIENSPDFQPKAF